MFVNFCSSHIFTIRSRGSRAVPSTETAFFIYFLNQFVKFLWVTGSDAAAPARWLESRLHPPQQTYRRYASRCRLYVLSWRQHLCYISSPVCGSGRVPGISVAVGGRAESVYLILGLTKIHNHLFCCLCSRWGDCSQTMPQWLTGSLWFHITDALNNCRIILYFLQLLTKQCELYFI